MISLKPDELNPVVHIANYHQVDQGQKWPDRTLGDLQFILIIKGQLQYEDRQNSHYVLSQGQVLFIEPGIQHTITSLQNSATIYGIHCEFLPQASWASHDYRLDPQPNPRTDLDDFNEIHQLFKQCTLAFNSHSRYRSSLTSSICRTLLLRLAEQWHNPTSPELSARMQEILEFIRQYLDKPITRHDLARAFYLTPEHINLLFKRELGQTPTEVLNRERCLRAYDLLQDRRISVKTAALQVGFNDPLFFSRVFRKIFQMPPSKAR